MSIQTRKLDIAAGGPALFLEVDDQKDIQGNTPKIPSEPIQMTHMKKDYLAVAIEDRRGPGAVTRYEAIWMDQDRKELARETLSNGQIFVKAQKVQFQAILETAALGGTVSVESLAGTVAVDTGVDATALTYTASATEHFDEYFSADEFVLIEDAYGDGVDRLFELESVSTDSAVLKTAASQDIVGATAHNPDKLEYTAGGGEDISTLLEAGDTVEVTDAYGDGVDQRLTVASAPDATTLHLQENITAVISAKNALGASAVYGMAIQVR